MLAALVLPLSPMTSFGSTLPRATMLAAPSAAQVRHSHSLSVHGAYGDEFARTVYDLDFHGDEEALAIAKAAAHH